MKSGVQFYFHNVNINMRHASSPWINFEFYGTVEIPVAMGCGIGNSSRVVTRAGVEVQGRNVDLSDHGGGFSIPQAKGDSQMGYLNWALVRPKLAGT